MKTISLELLAEIISDIQMTDEISEFVYVNDLWEYIEERNF
jgi:hypothetical protein